MRKFYKTKKTVIIYSFIIFLIWSAINGISIWWNIEIEKNVTTNIVTNIARASFNKDQAYRQWATSHGGVYVEPTEKTPPSPWMAHIEDRDITTTDGKNLTLMNPAYMLREMMQDYSELYGIKGRIVGKVYLNENNRADEWESRAIDSFEEGMKEIMEFTKEDGIEYLRLMKPMIMNQKCQKCHGHLGFPNGSVRGGVSVSVPLAEYRENEEKSILHIIFTYLSIWAIGVVALVVITINIITHLKRRSEDLEEIIISSQVFNNTLDAIFITDRDANILRVNKSFTDLTGYTKEEAVGKNPKILKSDHHDLKFYEKLWFEIIERGYIQVEIWNRDKDGEIFVAIESISCIRDDENEIKYFIATMHDITARKNAEDRITHMAHYDPLTNLPNRVLFQARFIHSIKTADKVKNKVALAFIDIDGFKKVNDTKGHPTGDKLLIEIAKIIKSCIKKSDTVSRLGGDEFTIIFENITEINSILPTCEKILQNLEKEIVIDEQSIFISASIGISIYPDDGLDIHTLIQYADIAMYRAKEDGKNRFNFYEESMTKQANERVSLETAIQSAIKNSEFCVYYQPKIATQNREVIGMEALVRWISPDKGFIPPDKFISVAEDMHIVDKIDMFVLEQVCKDMSSWDELGFDYVKVSVNLSGYDIKDDNLFENIKDIVNRYEIDSKRIEFEITETYFVNFAKENIQTLQNLKDFGFTLSIDDFGTGYSSLSNLKNLPVDILKIDQSFIRTMIEQKDSKTLVDMIIKLSHTFSLKVIAEGVETKEDYEYLKSQKCDYIQGYLESKPLPKEQFIKYLKAKKGD